MLKRCEDHSHSIHIIEICLIKSTSELIRDNTFHHYVNSESVEPRTDEGINGTESRPNIVLALGAGKVLVAEFRTTLVDTENCGCVRSSKCFLYGFKVTAYT